MPELPEVEALALDLKGRLDGHAIGRVHVVAFSALKTFDPPVQALEGTLVDDVTRHGKFLDIEASAGCTWSSTSPGPAGSAGATSSRRCRPAPATSRRWPCA